MFISFLSCWPDPTAPSASLEHFHYLVPDLIHIGLRRRGNAEDSVAEGKRHERDLFVLS